MTHYFLRLIESIKKGALSLGRAIKRFFVKVIDYLRSFRSFRSTESTDGETPSPEKEGKHFSAKVIDYLLWPFRSIKRGILSLGRVIKRFSAKVVYYLLWPFRSIKQGMLSLRQAAKRFSVKVIYYLLWPFRSIKQGMFSLRQAVKRFSAKVIYYLLWPFRSIKQGMLSLRQAVKHFSAKVIYRLLWSFRSIKQGMLSLRQAVKRFSAKVIYCLLWPFRSINRGMLALGRAMKRFFAGVIYCLFWPSRLLRSIHRGILSFWEETKNFLQVEIIGRLKDVGKLRQMLGASDFALPVKAWNATGHVLISILAASLLVNVLSLAFPLALLQIYDRIIPNVAMNTLALLVAGVGIALILEAIMKVSRSYVGAWADAKFEHVVGCQAFRRITECSLLEFEREGSGKHMKRLNSLGTLRDFYAGQAIVSLVDLPFVVILLALIAYIGGPLVFVPIVMLTIFLSLAVQNAKRFKTILDDRRDQDDWRSNFIIETLSNIHTVKSVAMEAQMQRRYERLQRTSASSDHDVSVRSSKSAGMGASLSQLTLVAVVSFGSLLVIKGDLTIGGLAACTLLSGRCLQPVNMVVGLWSRLQAIKIARDELDELLQTKEESSPELPDIQKLEGKLELQNVNFRYADDAEWLFKDVSLKVAPKEVISITGSGLSGKTTMAWLLMGMLKPTGGSILLDDQDASQFNASSYRKQIAYLPQQSVLFSGTIMENLTLFREDEYHDRALAAAHAVGLKDVIEHLPEGYDTQVANQAIESLPRGVNQSIAIARALLFKPAIVIFDEANIAIDMQGDIIIKSMLQKVIGKSTLILISHRPSILELAQRKYVLEDTRLREVA